MAADAGELVVKISADVSDIKKALEDIKGNVGNLGADTVAKGNLMADAFKKIGEAAIHFVEDSVRAFAEHEQAITRLTLAVGGPAAKSMADFAQQLQRTTAFSDDAILSLENQLTQYGVFPDSVKQATQALVDFAARTGKDLPEAGAMMAKAMAGQGRELKNYGIDVSVAASRSENLASVVQQLEGRFGGAAVVMKGTLSGSMANLTNQFEDLKKKIGEDLAPVLSKFLAWANDSIALIDRVINKNKQYSDTIEGQKEKLATLIANMKAQISNGVDLDKNEQDQIRTLVAHIKQLEAAANAHKKNTGATEIEIDSIRALKNELELLQQQEKNLGVITDLTTKKRMLGNELELAQLQADATVADQLAAQSTAKKIMLSQQELAELTAQQIEISSITDIETQKRLATAQLSWEAQASFSDQLSVSIQEDLATTTAQFADMAKTMISSFANSTAKMIVEGGKFSDVMKNLWQQLAEMVIAQILKMIAEWLVFQAMTGGSGGIIGGFAGGWAEGGVIDEPSVITGLRSGVTHIAGEAGPEAVVPMHKMGGSGPGVGSGSGGSGGITINITGQFLEGNQSTWNRMVQEQIIPQLRRFSMTQPNGVVNRKRGAMV